MPFNFETLRVMVIDSDFKIITIPINIDYLKTRSGILKGLQICLGFISFFLILYHCYYNYDPYYHSYTGFVGGKSETAFILISFACLLWTTLLTVCLLFSTTNFSVIPKTNFEITYNSIAFILYIISSLTLLFEVSLRGSDRINGISEPGFAGKIAASVFGLLSSIAYACSVYYSYIIYKSI